MHLARRFARNTCGDRNLMLPILGEDLGGGHTDEEQGTRPGTLGGGGI